VEFLALKFCLQLSFFLLTFILFETKNLSFVFLITCNRGFDFTNDARVQLK